VEKLVYVVWRRPGETPAGFREAFLGPVQEKLLAAGTRALTVNLVDERVDFALGKRLTRLDPPPDGVVTFWLDVCDDRQAHEAALAEATGRLAGYLVSESVPLRNTTHRAPLGERSLGTNMVGLLERPDWIEWSEWVRVWHQEHRAVALETQSTYLYVRNLVVRPLGEDAPPWAGIVFEGFPDDAVVDPLKWYDAEGSKDRLRANLARMIGSCKKFLELDRVESHPMSEYRLQEDL
jgi:hypothetical protein